MQIQVFDIIAWSQVGEAPRPGRAMVLNEGGWIFLKGQCVLVSSFFGHMTLTCMCVLLRRAPPFCRQCFYTAHVRNIRDHPCANDLKLT